MKPHLNSPNSQTAPDSSSAMPLPDSEIEGNIRAIQGDLRGYIISISGRSEDCDDTLQETNIFLWDRRTDFIPGTSFKAWAFKVAYFKVTASRRDRMRRGEIVFSEEMAQGLFVEAATATQSG